MKLKVVEAGNLPYGEGYPDLAEPGEPQVLLQGDEEAVRAAGALLFEEVALVPVKERRQRVALEETLDLFQRQRGAMVEALGCDPGLSWVEMVEEVRALRARAGGGAP